MGKYLVDYFFSSFLLRHPDDPSRTVKYQVKERSSGSTNSQRQKNKNKRNDGAFLGLKPAANCYLN